MSRTVRKRKGKRAYFKNNKSKRFPQRKIAPKQPTIPIVDPNKDYYISKKGKQAKESPTERIIRITLKKNNINFLSEVSFRRFGFPACPYRFDFYLPEHNTIIEYDGQHHSTTHVKENDALKNKFCRINNIKIYRFNIKHYPKLAFHIEKLLKVLTQ